MPNTFMNDPAKLDTALGEFNRKLKEEEAARQAQIQGIPYINLRNFPIDLNVLAMFTEDEARLMEALVFYKEGKDLRIATVNPMNPALHTKLDELSERYKCEMYVVSALNFDQVMKFYSKVAVRSEGRDETIRIPKASKGLDDLEDIREPAEQEKKNLTELLTKIFSAAAGLGISDIHIEPEGSFVKVRYRLDGVLTDVLHLSKNLQKQIISRIKIQSKIKLNIDNVPQDGRLTFYYKDQPIDVRVSTLPSAFGESIVMRLLNITGLTVGFDQLGFRGKTREVVEAALAKPNGMIITTGPTGSGKTTTLYSFLQELNEPGVKIITLEDPVEYKLEGITQTPIDHNADFSFSKALRAVLRQDPDIVMVGEIRDEETADTASQAALTGHIVLSTLHTNDAAGAIPRLYNMGVKPFVIAPALNCVIAQRLVRKICQFCKKEDTLDPKILEQIKQQLDTVPTNSNREVPKELKFYTSPGCRQCNNLSYKGRIGIFEVIDIDDEMEELILKEPTMIQVKKLAQTKGTVSMTQDGILKALEGVTDIAEVFRVAGV